MAKLDLRSPKTCLLYPPVSFLRKDVFLRQPSGPVPGNFCGCTQWQPARWKCRTWELAKRPCPHMRPRLSSSAEWAAGPAISTWGAVALQGVDQPQSPSPQPHPDPTWTLGRCSDGGPSLALLCDLSSCLNLANHVQNGSAMIPTLGFC